MALPNRRVQLNNLAMSQRWTVTYSELGQSGQPHAPTFISACELFDEDGKSLARGEGRGLTKHEAHEAAAEHVWTIASKLEMPPQELQAAMPNARSALHLWSQKHGFALSHELVEKRGHSHQPTFQSAVVMRDAKGDEAVPPGRQVGAHAHTLKEAQESAAQAALDALNTAA